eukprot:5083124-Pyramimonas_sp.AAC.1
MVRDILSGRGFANNRARDSEIREHGSGRSEIKTVKTAHVADFPTDNLPTGRFRLVDLSPPWEERME